MTGTGPKLRLVPPAAEREPPSDAVLVARAARGDAAAHETIFRRHAPIVLNLATRLLRHRAEAEDVLQETFEIVLGRIGELREPSALRGWVLQITVRQVHVRFRRRRLLRALGFVWPRASDDGALCPLESSASTDASPEHRAELALLDHSLSRLDPDDRLAWMLRHVEGLRLDEVAEAMECSLATVKRRIQRADRHVRADVMIERADEGERDGEESGDDHSA